MAEAYRLGQADAWDHHHAGSDCICRDYEDPAVWCENPYRADRENADPAQSAAATEENRP